MAYQFQVLRVDFRRLLSIPGSRDQSLLRALAPYLDSEPEPDDDDDEPEVTALEALRQIVSDTIPDEAWAGTPYSWALAAIYEHIGMGGGNLYLSVSEMQHIDAVDHALATAGAPSRCAYPI